MGNKQEVKSFLLFLRCKLQHNIFTKKKKHPGCGQFQLIWSYKDFWHFVWISWILVHLVNLMWIWRLWKWQTLGIKVFLQVWRSFCRQCGWKSLFGEIKPWLLSKRGWPAAGDWGIIQPISDRQVSPLFCYLSWKYFHISSKYFHISLKYFHISSKYFNISRKHFYISWEKKYHIFWKIFHISWKYVHICWKIFSCFLKIFLYLLGDNPTYFWPALCYLSLKYFNI